MSRKTDDLWSIVLAGGEGTRFAPLSQGLYGTNLPKQYATVVHDRSMLQQTIDRMLALVPMHRVIVVTQTSQFANASAQLRQWPKTTILAQPSNKGTGPAILLGLAHLRRRAPNSRVVIAPSDHYVPRPGPFLEGIAIAALAAARTSCTLIGVSPDRAETQYGWIVPGSGLVGDLCRVRSFFEKPSVSVAEKLLVDGALWNTMVTVGVVSSLWAMSAQHLPEQASLIDAALRDGCQEANLRDVFHEIHSANFSRDVLECARELSVLPVEGSGWCDWGLPEQVFSALRGLPEIDALRARLSQSWQCAKKLA